jgi:hypothetical protein
MSLSRVSLAALLLLPLPSLACVADPPAPADGKQDQAKTEAKQDAPEATPAGKYELTAEEIDLLARDPKTLGPDQNRKRAYALRKKIMQNPDSDAAKALEEARLSALSGQVEIPGQPPKEKGIVIEAPEYLRNMDQTYDRPVAAADEPSE